MNNNKLVVFGLVNCNRLAYLKSCLLSLKHCTQDYSNVRFIVVDNASVEEGTDEFLEEQRDTGVIVHKQEHRDPANEFASAKNFIVRTALQMNADYICPLAADMQFTLTSGWLTHYVAIYDTLADYIGNISFDAQRRVRNQSARFSEIVSPKNEFKFAFDYTRQPVAPSANSMFSRKNIEMLYPWHTDNEGHETGLNSEDVMAHKVRQLIGSKKLQWMQLLPIIPPSIGIYNEYGDNARIRGNRRYGQYLWPEDDEFEFRYFELNEYNRCIQNFTNRIIPVPIEEMARAHGSWTLPIDSSDNWIKNPLDFSKATDSDYVIVGDEADENNNDSIANDEYLDEWLNE